MSAVMTPPAVVPGLYTIDYCVADTTGRRLVRVLRQVDNTVSAVTCMGEPLEFDMGFWRNINPEPMLDDPLGV